MREGKSVSPVTHRHGAWIGVSRFEGPTKVRGPFRRSLADPIWFCACGRQIRGARSHRWSC